MLTKLRGNRKIIFYGKILIELCIEQDYFDIDVLKLNQIGYNRLMMLEFNIFHNHMHGFV